MRTVLAIAVGALGLLVAAPAWGNGRFPAANQIVFSPSDPALIVLRATFGVVVSRDGGATWTWLCEDALGIVPSLVEDPSVGVTATNAFLAGLRTGLDVSSDTGCNWTFAGEALANQSVFDVVVRRDDPHAVVVGVSTVTPLDAGEAGAGSGHDNQLFASADDGAHWAALGVPFDPGLLVTTFDVAPSDPTRIYAAGVTEAAGGTRSFWMTVSKSAGAQWTEVPLPLDPATEQEPFVAAVDPTNPDRVYVRSQGSPSRLFVSTDAGQTFQVAFSLLNPITGFALSPDGATVFAGSSKDGLYAAPAAGLGFQKVSSLPVGCLAARAGELWACSTDASGFAVGVSTDRGVTFTPKLRLADIRGPVACGDGATAAVCGISSAAFSNLCTLLNECFATGPLTPEYDGGPPASMTALCRSGPSCPCQALGSCSLPDAGGGASDGGAATAPLPRRTGCGCAVANGGSAAGLLAVGALAAAAARRRQSSSRGRGHRR